MRAGLGSRRVGMITQSHGVFPFPLLQHPVLGEAGQKNLPSFEKVGMGLCVPLSKINSVACLWCSNAVHLVPDYSGLPDRPSNKGTRLLFEVLKAIIIITE